MRMLEFVLETLVKEDGFIGGECVCDYLAEKDGERCDELCHFNAPTEECYFRYFERLKNETD